MQGSRGADAGAQKP